MVTDRSHETEIRLRQLEVSLRRLRTILMSGGLLTLLVSVAAFTIARPDRPANADVEDEVRAGAFRLVDDRGDVRASLFLSASGPMFALYDTVGVPRASLEHGSEETALYLRDASGTIRVGAAQFAHGGGGFAIHGEQAKGASVLYMAKGHGRLTFYSADGEVLGEFAPVAETGD